MRRWTHCPLALRGSPSTRAGEASPVGERAWKRLSVAPVLCFPMEVRGQSLQGFFGPSWNMPPQEWLSGLLWGTSYKDRGGRGVVLQKRAN